MADFQPKMEIPEALRSMAEQNVAQARLGYQQLMDSLHQAQQQLSRSHGAMTQSAMEVQSRIVKFTEDNVRAGFDFAAELARARDLKEMFEIQARQAKKQMETYAAQAQELGRLMAEVAQKSTGRT